MQKFLLATVSDFKVIRYMNRKSDNLSKNLCDRRNRDNEFQTSVLEELESQSLWCAMELSQIKI